MSRLVSQRTIIYLIAIASSVLLAYWSMIREVVINSDGICYLQSAQTMATGLSAAMHLCDQAKWPLYSALIYFVSSFTKLSMLQSAYLLDGVLSLISVVTFITIMRFVKDTPRVLWCAAFVILMAHEFNVVREYIVRDHGFWAFYLLSILFLLHFLRTFEWCYALAWSMSLVIATLFRIEGLIFLLFLPLFALLNNTRRISSFLKLNTFTLVGVALIAAGLFLYPQYGLEQLGRVNEVKLQFVNGFGDIVQKFQAHADVLGKQILSQYAVHDAQNVMVLMLISWYMFNVASNLSIIYAVLVVYAWGRRLLTADYSTRLILWSYVLVNVAITFIFLAENMFLSKRYLLALSLTLMLWVPLALDDLWAQWSKRKWPFFSAMFFILMFGVSGIVEFGHSKKYISDAGHWLAVNVPQEDKLYSNSYPVMYYSQHFGNDIFTLQHEYSQPDALTDNKWKGYHYLALRVNQKEELNPELVNQLGTPVQIFTNDRGDAVNIYKVVP